jgi:ribosome biogenesis GTPase A
MDVQWYPGHMTKARRMMEENIRLVDLVIELVDARIPLSSRNPDIDALCKGKGRVVLLCKADLADPERTEEFTEYFRSKGILAVAVDARERRAGEIVRRYMQEAGREKIARDRARGIVGRPLRAMVAGIPNVGKSTFINSFAGRASTRTGNKPGVTRGKQWIRLGGDVELLDTPGILWPKFDNQLIGMRLALVGAIRDEILDKQELAVWLIDYLQRDYPGMLESKYLTSQDPAGAADAAQEETTGREPVQEDLSREAMLPPGYVMLLKIARARRLLMKGGEPDAYRAAALLIDDCKNGRIGRLSLDRPQDAEQMEEERRAFTAAQEQEKEAAARKKAAAGAGSSRAGSGENDRGKTRGNPGRKGGQDTRCRSAERGGQSARGRSADRGGQSARGASSRKGGAKSSRNRDRDRGRQGRG